MSTSLRRRMLLLAMVSLPLVAAPTAFAQQATQGLQIKPTVIEDKAKPGDVYNFVMTVTNLSDRTRTFNLTAQDISGLNEAGQPVFAPATEQTQFELSSWVQLPTAPMTLQPNETKQFSYFVHVPSSVSPGSHFGGIFLDENVPAMGNNPSGVAMKVGSVMSLLIAGDTTEDARLREFSTDKLVYDSANVAFTIKIENVGNVMERPHGIITLTDMFGHQAASVPIDEKQAAVFPKGERSYTVQWKSDDLAFGRYEAIASFVYGTEGAQTISATTSFWVLPIRLILYVFGGVIGVIVLLYFFIRARIRRL